MQLCDKQCSPQKVMMYSQKEKVWQRHHVTPSQAVPINKETELEE
jgi:hypothetical protein